MDGTGVGIRYSDRYRTSGVRWYRVVGVECHVKVLLSASIGRRGKSNAGRSSHGPGNVAQASTIDLVMVWEMLPGSVP